MIRMALHLFGYDLRAFLRNRQSQFFTLALPVLFLVIFASVFGGSGHTTAVAGGRISTSVYYVPGIIALGVIAACFGNLVASVTAQRERGVLKRRGATVPAAAVIAGRVLAAVASRWSWPPCCSASGGPPTAPTSPAAPPWPSRSPW